MNNIIQLKQTPFIAVVVPDFIERIEIKDNRLCYFANEESGLEFWGDESTPLPLGTWSIVIPSVRKATEEEIKMAKIVAEPYAPRIFVDYETNDFEATCNSYKQSLDTLMTASMPEGMLWVNPYGEKEPAWRDLPEPKNLQESIVDAVADSNHRNWYYAQKKLVGDAVILKQE